MLMAADRLITDYLHEAAEAEILSASVGDEVMRVHWRAIANGYRNLAQARLLATSAPPVKDP